VLAAYLELWRREPILRRTLMVSLLADTAFGALIPFVNFYLSDELKAPPHITGFAFAGYLAVEAIFKAPFGALSDRWGRKAVMVLGLMITVTATILLGTIRSHYAVMLLFPLAGVGFAAFFPTIAAFVADYAPEEHRGWDDGHPKPELPVRAGNQRCRRISPAPQSGDLQTRLFRHSSTFNARCRFGYRRPAFSEKGTTEREQTEATFFLETTPCPIARLIPPYSHPCERFRHKPIRSVNASSRHRPLRKASLEIDGLRTRLGNLARCWRFSPHRCAHWSHLRRHRQGDIFESCFGQVRLSRWQLSRSQKA